jgi:hypothetical protein
METATEIVSETMLERQPSTSAEPSDIARWAPVIVGTRDSVLTVLEKEFPLVAKDAGDKSQRYFYAVLPFADQIDRVMRYNKTAGNKYVYAVIPYHEHIPEAEMPEELKNIPEEYRTLRFVRVEIHR